MRASLQCAIVALATFGVTRLIDHLATPPLADPAGRLEQTQRRLARGGRSRRGRAGGEREAVPIHQRRRRAAVAAAAPVHREPRPGAHGARAAGQ